VLVRKPIRGFTVVDVSDTVRSSFDLADTLSPRNIPRQVYFFSDHCFQTVPDNRSGQHHACATPDFLSPSLNIPPATLTPSLWIFRPKSVFRLGYTSHADFQPRLRCLLKHYTSRALVLLFLRKTPLFFE